MKTPKGFLLIFLFIGTLAHAQGGANIWYFGDNAGLDFNSGAPVALLDGQLDTDEGCSTLSDANGNLLFYSDGITVWNRNHAVMANGTGLLGNASSTQSAIFAPQPGDPNRYYVFTVDLETGANGLRYSEIDLSLDGGLGAVIGTKNIALDSPVTEKVTAVEHANGTWVWVMAHRWNSNEFIAYLIDDTGIITTPVVSGVGLPHNGIQQHAIGYMKFSATGDKLALARSYDDSFVQVFDFDNSTGQVSNPITINYGSDLTGAYGVEFSLDGQILYISDTESGFSGYSRIYQYDLNAGSEAAILASERLLLDSSSDLVYALQMAPDGNIYVARLNEDFLGVITDPGNLAGAAYSPNGADLAGRRSKLGLPPFVQSLLLPNDFRFENLCLGDTTQFFSEVSGNVSSYFWDFGDGATSTLENPTHVYAAAGTYTVSLTIVINGISQTTTQELTIVTAPVANAVSNIELCASDPISFDLSTKDPEVLNGQSPTLYGVSYHPTQNDADNATNAFAFPDMFADGQEVFYRLFTQNSPECYVTGSFFFEIIAGPTANTIDPQSFCDQDPTVADNQIILSSFDASVLGTQSATSFTITYYLSAADATAGTNALSDPFTTTQNSVVLHARIESNSDAACFDTTSFTVNVGSAPIAGQPMDLEVCDFANNGSELVDLSATVIEIINGQTGTFNVSFHLSQMDADANSNAQGQPYLLNSPTQTLFARLQDMNGPSCYDTTSFQLALVSSPTSGMAPDLTRCDDPSGDGMESFDFSPQIPLIINGQAGNYEVSFHESAAEADAGSNPLPVNYTNQQSPQEIFVRLTSLDGEPCYDLSSFFIEVIPTPPPVIVERFLCEGLPTVLDAGTGFDSYLWSTGETTPSISVSDPGTYTVTTTSGGASMCTSMTTFVVQLSEPPVFQGVQISDWTANRNSFTVEVSGTGTYEYSLDDITYQTSNTFTDLRPGEYTVFIRDVGGCAELQVTVSLLFYPNYFTPNGDGFHDTWQIIASEFEPDMFIYIFDRYGKLIKQLDPLSEGWDGTYNGRNLPSTDYWFLVEREDGRSFRGHFSLVRR
ncbi:T9SS type B sorting domain-containing protein [Croceiramulus getboli]|nr:T9SS type B sorting domain-containing protein [Flavobacteriaceae bacterium YJPT1-3]